MTFMQLSKQALKEQSEKDYTRAFNLYNKVLHCNLPDRTIVKIMSKQAWCLYSVGNPADADTIINRIIQDYDNEPLSSQVAAKYFIKTDRIKSAKKLLQSGIKKFPDNLEIYLILASLLKDTERSNEAIEVLKSTLLRENLTRGKGINRKDIWAELGHLYFDRGDYNSSLACLKKSMRMDSEENFFHYDLLAICSFKLDDPKSCIKYISHYFNFLGETDQEILIYLARANCRLGNMAEAKKAFYAAYKIEEQLTLKAEELLDLAKLKQAGVFDHLENLEIEGDE